jgi:alpha-tubulin suppressor-like RCC1 family protein
MARYLTILLALLLLLPACTTDFHGDTDGDEDADGDDTEVDGADVDTDPGTDPDAADAPDDGDEPDGTPTCTNDGDCSDGNDCNGHETCNVDSGECAAGEPEPDGFVCGSDPRSICLDGECTASICGDGFTDTGAGEFCDPPGEGACLEGCELGCDDDVDCADDGNPCNGEEICDMTDHVCDRTSPPGEGTACGADPRRICLSGSCQESICGDGWTDEGADPAEECDDDNTNPNDGCKNDCTFTCHIDDDCLDDSICNGAEQCNASHVCVPGEVAAEGTHCESDGIDCTADRCSGTGACNHDILDDACLIGGTCRGDGEHMPGNACRTCQPGLSQTDWSDLAVLRGVRQVAVGDLHACALMNDGMRIKCWGAGWAGQLGSGAPTGSYTPVDVDRSSFGSAPVSMIAVGANHSCALLDGGTMWCWGSNNDGELGKGDVNAVNPAPILVPGISGLVQIGLGWDHSCAVVGSGQMYCWGKRDSGQCGTYDGASPEDLLDPGFVWDDITGGVMNGALAADGGANHTCALVETDRIRCWGHNGTGQLGDNTTNQQNYPVYVVNASDPATTHEDFAAVTTGSAYTCALNSRTEQAECWGANNEGQLGDGTHTQRLMATVVLRASSVALPNVTQISAGYEHTCAVTAGDAALCWGSNSNGQLGVGTGSLREYYANPVLLDDTGTELTNVKAIDTGFNVTCAIVGDERDLYCWGRDNEGMLGNGLPLENAFFPAAVTCTP